MRTRASFYVYTALHQLIYTSEEDESKLSSKYLRASPAKTVLAEIARKMFVRFFESQNPSPARKNSTQTQSTDAHKIVGNYSKQYADERYFLVTD